MTDDRKSRLAALAAKAKRPSPAANSTNDGDDNMIPSNDSKPVLTFRNYVPKDVQLDSQPQQPLLESDTSSSVSKRPRSSIAEESSSCKKSILEEALAKTSRESREAAGQNVKGSSWSQITPISSKKVNWDLKRDIAAKMERLERRTQRAIVELLRERLEREAAEDEGASSSDDLD